ncbi:MAG: cyclophilin family peptidyl-prolyl cis-trans isomerase [Planctomycetota bacterium]|jgi:cyclophilin family peptidyl-prolyl cis-trans isomerase
MADHKAPTDVTLVAHEERSEFAEFVNKHWMKAVLVALVGSAAILFNQWKASQADRVDDASWDSLMSVVDYDKYGGMIADPSLVDGMSAELSKTMAGPWALFLKARGYREEGHYDLAISTLAEVKAGYPEHPLVTDSRTYGEAVTPLTAIEYLTKVFAAEAKWHKEAPSLFANPDLPANAPKVRIQTDYGDIVVALYSDAAPLHAENFLKLAGEGYYNGLKFHRSNFGRQIESGDPTTKEEDSDPMSWGKQGAEHSVENEDTGFSNFAGSLVATSLPPAEGSNGSLFAILASSSHYLDGNNVVFGKVVEGLDIVEEIAQLPADPTTQVPSEPATLQSMTVVPGA